MAHRDAVHKGEETISSTYEFFYRYFVFAFLAPLP
jgi:hypothetical protein